MNLKDLKPSILELSEEEALRLILNIRESRGQVKRVTKERARPPAPKAEVGLDMRKLTLEQLEALVQNLDKDKGGV